MKTARTLVAAWVVLANLLPSPAGAAPASDDRASLEKWAKQTTQTLKQACAKPPAEYARKYDELETEYMTKSARFGDAKIKSWAAERKPSGFLDLGREVWPLVASPALPMRDIFVPCGELSDGLHKTLASGQRLEKAALQAWEECVEHSYRDHMPPLTKALQACLRSQAK